MRAASTSPSSLTIFQTPARIALELIGCMTLHLFRCGCLSHRNTSGIERYDPRIRRVTSAPPLDVVCLESVKTEVKGPSSGADLGQTYQAPPHFFCQVASWRTLE